MNAPADKNHENKSQLVSSAHSKLKTTANTTFSFADNRPETIAQRKMQEWANNNLKVAQHTSFQAKSSETTFENLSIGNEGVIQKATYDDMDTMWQTEFQNETWLVTDDKDLLANYNEAKAQLPYVDFLNTPGADPHVDPNVVREDGRITIRFDRTNPNNWDPDFFVAAIIHELIHIANLRKYEKNSDPDETGLAFANFHLPEPESLVKKDGLAPNQVESIRSQLKILGQNWEDLYTTAENDNKKGLFTELIFKHLKDRIQYGGGKAIEETDTVLFDISFYLAIKELTTTDTFKFVKRLLREATDRRNTPGKKVSRVDAQAYWIQFWKW
ncbi:MAG: hypothetical protein ABIQ40_18555 [Bacteroidia bacterium]